MALDFYYALLLPANQTAGVLLRVGELAAAPLEGRSELALPDGGRIRVPFPSPIHEGKTIPLGPGTRVRLDTILTFPLEGPMQAPPGPEPPVLAHRLRVRLWIYIGQRYAKVVFSAADDRASRLLAGSKAIRTWLWRLLEDCQGFAGVLDTDGEQLHLLPDLQTCVDPLDVGDYFGPGQVFDVDRWAQDLLELEVRPVEPPVVDLGPDEDVGAVRLPLNHLENAFGPWHGPIPPRYHRTFEEKPFDRCDYCHRPLLEPDTEYAIVKLHFEGELRQEMVMCSACGEEMQESYSQESQQAMERIFSRVPLHQRLRLASGRARDRLARMTERCLLCSKLVEEVSGYAEYAHCQASELVYHVFPAIICDGCMVRVNDALSDKTKDEWRRFYDEHYGFPPAGWPARERVEDELPVWIAL